MRRPIFAAAVVLVLGGFAAVAAAQHGDQGSHADAGGAPHRRMQAAQEEFDQVLAQGLGGGLHSRPTRTATRDPSTYSS